MIRIAGVVLVAAAWGVPGAGPAAEPPGPPTEPAWSREQLEADWLRQAELRTASGVREGPGVTPEEDAVGGCDLGFIGDREAAKEVTPEEDAVGGCDGVVNSAWGFHTALKNDPWWQVDLGGVLPLARVRVWNRTDFAERASRIAILLSSDGREFREAYRHDGTPFLGHADGKPLDVELGGRVARWVVSFRQLCRQHRFSRPGTGGRPSAARGGLETPAGPLRTSDRVGAGSRWTRTQQSATGSGQVARGLPGGAAESRPAPQREVLPRSFRTVVLTKVRRRSIVISSSRRRSMTSA